MPTVTLRPDINPSDALKVDALCSRILGDIGSVHRRTTPGTGALPPELVELRRYVREMQDAVRDQVPDAFYK